MKSFVRTTNAFIFSVSLDIALLLPTIASAYQGIAVYGYQYRQYIECTLINQRKSGSIKIGMFPASNKIKNYSVRMTDERGRHIWEESRALSWNGNRNFYLGNDHKVYRSYISSNGGNGNVATATVLGSSNVRIKTAGR